VFAGEYVTLEECHREMDHQLCLVTFNRLMDLIGEPNQKQVHDVIAAGMHEPYGRVSQNPAEAATVSLSRMGIGVDFIRRDIAKNEYIETIERSFGPMKKLYTQVEFSPSADQELRRHWDEFRRTVRFAVVGVGAGSVLGLVGLAFGLLKVDTWTRGYYTKRLFLGVPAAIIGLLALLGMAAG
jgi:hypothetical protein